MSETARGLGLCKPAGTLMDDIFLARLTHILALLHWIGGVAFVTLTILPEARRLAPAEGFLLFARAERAFSAQVKFSIPLAGAAGLWMVWRLDLWSRFADPQFWWMHAMVAVWGIFALIVFVVEPLVAARLEQMARQAPEKILALLLTAHRILLAGALIAFVGAFAGARGVFF